MKKLFLLLICLVPLFVFSQDTIIPKRFKTTIGAFIGAGNNSFAKSVGFDFNGFVERQLTTKIDFLFKHGVVHSSQFNKEEDENYLLVKRYLYQKTNASIYYVPIRKPKHEFQIGGGPQFAYLFRKKGPNIFEKDKSIAAGLVASCMYEARPWEKITVGIYLNYEPMFGKNKNGIGNTFFGVVVGSNF